MTAEDGLDLKGLPRFTPLDAMQMPFIFRAILMNLKPLLKHFPEVHHLPLDEQIHVLQQAQKLAAGPDNKLQVWRDNMVALTLLILLCGIVIAVVGPLFNLAASTTAIILMIVIFPLFMLIQHRRQIGYLRPALQKVLAQHQDGARQQQPFHQ